MQLFYSIFFNAIGNAIINSVWQMAVIWIVYVIINAILKPLSTVQYNMAVASMITGFIWFTYTLLHYIYYPTTFNQDFVFISSNLNQSWLYNISIFLKSSITYVGFIYLIALLFLLIQFYFQYKSSRQLYKNNLTEMAPQWQKFIECKIEQWSYSKQIRVFVSEHISTPCTLGFIKPIILLPLASITQLSTKQLEAVLLHEFAHIRRNDYAWNIGISFISSVLFFNPFVRQFKKIIVEERELCCDSFVVAENYSNIEYAQALYKLATIQQSALYIFSMAAVTDKQSLLYRIQRLLNSKETVKKYSVINLVSFFALTMITFFLYAQKLKEHSPNHASLLKTEPVQYKSSNTINIKTVDKVAPQNSPQALKKRNGLANKSWVEIKTEYMHPIVYTIPLSFLNHNNSSNETVPVEFKIEDENASNALTENSTDDATENNIVIQNTVLREMNIPGLDKINIANASPLIQQLISKLNIEQLFNHSTDAVGKDYDETKKISKIEIVLEKQADNTPSHFTVKIHIADTGLKIPKYY